MAQYANNELRQVVSYNRSGLALLSNSNCAISTFNTKFKDFQNYAGNLGSSVTFTKPPRFTDTQGLVATWQAYQQLFHTLSCDQARNVSFSVTDQDQMFNLDNSSEMFMKDAGISAIGQLGNAIEVNVLRNATSSVPVMTVIDGQNVPTGAMHTESGPYLYYGDGTTPINTFAQIAQIIALQKNYGAPKNAFKLYMPDMVYPSIVNSGLSQFTLERNDEMAKTWEMGSFKGGNSCNFYSSNLLPIHNAGSLGDTAATLTLVSTNDPTGNNITQLTFSGAGTDSQAVKSGDVMSFLDGVANQPDIRYLTYQGGARSANKVQIRAIASSASSGGNVTIDITPALKSSFGIGQNLSRSLAPGMQIKIEKTHRAGFLISGEAAFLAMPKLPTETPFMSSSEMDPDTAVGLRLSYGSLLGQNQKGFIYSGTWGSTIVPEYSRRVLFPVNQGIS